jgi:hypothetical protein
MTPASPMPGIRRGRRRGYWITVLSLPLAVYLLGNLWLLSPPGRGWVAAKIQARVRLESKLGGVTISPWNGVSLHDLQILQPEPLRNAISQPLARIHLVRLTPVWRAWMRGKLELRAVELDSPQIALSIELLADLARSQAAGRPAPASPPTAGPPPLAGPPPVGPPAPAPPIDQPSQTSPPATPAPVSLSPNSWLHLKQASFTLVSASSGRKWFSLSGLEGSIPVAGKPAQSVLRVHSIDIAERQAFTDLQTSLEWKAPLLVFKPTETDLQGFKIQIAAQIALLGGLPLRIDVQAPRQKLEPFALPADGRVRAEAIAANARFRGLLLAPGTWQADLIAETVSAAVTFADKEAKFDRGSSVTILRGGVVSCVDARLIGDELSFLGNATLLADGRLAAVLRMVAAPDTANAIAGRLFPSLPQPVSLTPLATPQRAAFDLHAFGNISRVSLKLGTDGPFAELGTR